MACCSALFVLFVLHQASGQAVVPKVVLKGVVENVTTNVDIVCGLDHPQYWKIQDRVYDLYGVPEIFEVRGHEALRLANVDRRMNGWTFLCFTIDDDGGINLDTTINQLDVQLLKNGKDMHSLG
jgi:hypothetical protein